MKRVTLIATALVLAVLAVLATKVAAQESNTREITYLTFSNAVELPGVTLPAGTYTFRLADTPTRNVVQVLDRDQKNMMGQWLFVQAERPEVTGDTVIMFKENREGATPAVQYWYFPGEKIGKEFIYPKDQAQKIAARTGQQVRSEEGYVTSSDAAVSSADSQNQVADNAAAAHSQSTDNAAGAQSQVADNSSSRSDTINGSGLPPADSANNSAADDTLRNAPASAQPSAAAGSLAGNRGANTSADSQVARQDTDRDVAITNDNNNNNAVGTSGSNSADNRPVGTTARAEQLPKTASSLPLSGLIGLLSLAGALGTRAYATARR